MCGGMKYRHTDPETGEIAERSVYFPRPHALIPIIDDNGESLCQWGRREREDREFDVPQTGWARLESLEKDYWQRYSPSLVLIPALEFCEKPEGFKLSAWYPSMRPGTYLKGLKLDQQGKTFVYVITQVPRVIFRDIDRVPVIVNADFEPEDELKCDFEAALAAQAPKPKRKRGDAGQLGFFR